MAVYFYGLSTRSKISILALGAVILVVGGILLVFGLTLLIGLSALGGVLAVGARVYQKLTGHSPFHWNGAVRQPRDASQEVFLPEDQKLLLRHQEQEKPESPQDA